MLNIEPQKLIDYIYKIKNKHKTNLYTIINPTLSMNPFVGKFVYRLFSNDILITPKVKLFLKWTKLYYKIKFKQLKEYYIAYKDYKQYYKKKIKINSNDIILDLYLNNKDIKLNNKYNDTYLESIYPILDNHNKSYIFLLRLITADYKDYKSFFKIASKDSKKYIIEFDYLNHIDFLKITLFILIYPFNTLKLLQKEKSHEDIIFNVSLIRDISNLQFDSITRYYFAKKLAKNKNINKIYSWCENQSINRTFYYGIKSQRKDIHLISLQFYLNPKNYFNSTFYDNDCDNAYIPHQVLVNGKYFLKQRTSLDYQIGISPRYTYIFKFNRTAEMHILILGTYFTNINMKLIDISNTLKKTNILFKPHPHTKQSDLKRLQCPTSNSSLEKLFQTTKIIIASNSGTIVEAVSCGISVLVIRDKEYINLEYLCDIGKGVIWDYLDNIDDIEYNIEKLLSARKNSKDIEKIVNWYKENFFEESTKEKIINIFS